MYQPNLKSVVLRLPVPEIIEIEVLGVANLEEEEAVGGRRIPFKRVLVVPGPP